MSQPITLISIATPCSTWLESGRVMEGSSYSLMRYTSTPNGRMRSNWFMMATTSSGLILPVLLPWICFGVSQTWAAGWLPGHFMAFPSGNIWNSGMVFHFRNYHWMTSWSSTSRSKRTIQKVKGCFLFLKNILWKGTSHLQRILIKKHLFPASSRLLIRYWKAIWPSLKITVYPISGRLKDCWESSLKLYHSNPTSQNWQKSFSLEEIQWMNACKIFMTLWSCIWWENRVRGLPNCKNQIKYILKTLPWCMPCRVRQKKALYAKPILWTRSKMQDTRLKSILAGVTFWSKANIHSR